MQVSSVGLWTLQRWPWVHNVAEAQAHERVPLQALGIGMHA